MPAPANTDFDSTHTFALYVHIPYCVNKCPYCDFNSYAIDTPHSPLAALPAEAHYVEAVLSELAAFSTQSPWKGNTLSSIFFGGGTPSLFQASSIAKILEAARTHWQWEEDIEITLEANPGTLREELALEKLSTLRQAGVNRLSFGAQSLRSEKLVKLGRIHTVEDVANSLSLAERAGFKRINLDCMYGLPGETLDTWESELKEFLATGVSHLSAYTLTIEPGTEFARKARKGIAVQAADDVLAEMYRLTQQLMGTHGLEQYEVSNFAKTGEACRHNLTYWRWQNYLGIGAGAHSFIRRSARQEIPVSRRFAAIPKPSHYIERISAGEPSAQNLESLSVYQEKLEVLYCFVRTSTGLCLKQYQNFFGPEVINELAPAIQQLSSDGLLKNTATGVQLSERGYLFSDYVLQKLAESVVDH